MRNYTPNEKRILDAIMDNIDRQVPGFSTMKVETSGGSKYIRVYGKVRGKECDCGGFSIQVTWTEGD